MCFYFFGVRVGLGFFWDAVGGGVCFLFLLCSCMVWVCCVFFIFLVFGYGGGVVCVFLFFWCSGWFGIFFNFYGYV